MAQPTVSRWSRGALAIKTETTYGTDATPGSADIVFARNIAFRVVQAQFRDDRIAGASAQLPDIPGARAASVSFECLLHGAGAAYAANVKPEVDAILRALGYAAAGSFTGGSEKWTYTPQAGATMGESVSVQFVVENAPSGKLLGCFGTGRISARAGEPGVLAVTLQGLYQTPADVSMITAAPSSVQQPQFRAAAVTLDGQTCKVGMMELDLGNDVQLKASANDAQAYDGCVLNRGRIQATFDPEAVAGSTYNFHSKRDTGALVTAAWQLGTLQYNRVLFSAPKLQYLDVSETQRQGLRAYQLACLLVASSGGDELSIVFS